MKKFPKLARLVKAMTPVERAILFAFAELENSSTIDTRTRLMRAQLVAQTGDYEEATVGVAIKLGELAKLRRRYVTILDTLIEDHETEERQRLAAAEAT